MHTDRIAVFDLQGRRLRVSGEPAFRIEQILHPKLVYPSVSLGGKQPLLAAISPCHGILADSSANSPHPSQSGATGFARVAEQTRGPPGSFLSNTNDSPARRSMTAARLAQLCTFIVHWLRFVVKQLQLIGASLNRLESRIFRQFIPGRPVTGENLSILDPGSDHVGIECVT